MTLANSKVNKTVQKTMLAQPKPGPVLNDCR